MSPSLALKQKIFLTSFSSTPQLSFFYCVNINFSKTQFYPPPFYIFGEKRFWNNKISAYIRALKLSIS
jgi:hypothetical protein